MSEEETDSTGGEIDSEAMFSLFGRAHTLDILAQIAVKSDPPFRFTTLEESLEISPNTLSRRLEELVEAGFLDRHSYDEIPPRVEYEPTEKLQDLRPMFLEFEKWMDKHGEKDEFALLES